MLYLISISLPYLTRQAERVKEMLSDTGCTRHCRPHIISRGPEVRRTPYSVQAPGLRFRLCTTGRPLTVYHGVPTLVVLALTKGTFWAIWPDEACFRHWGKPGFLHFFTRAKHTKQYPSNYAIRELECHYCQITCRKLCVECPASPVGFACVPQIQGFSRIKSCQPVPQQCHSKGSVLPIRQPLLYS